jgi:hypothetical protein
MCERPTSWLPVQIGVRLFLRAAFTRLSFFRLGDEGMNEDNINVSAETVTQANARQSETRAGVGSKQSSPAVAKNSTGPRTAAGKQKSSRNALKSGIFSKFLILKSESRAEYQLVLNGVREDLQPQGTVESALVESLTAILWRKRRLLQAESAEISKVRFFRNLDAFETQQVEVWDRYRAGETAGGMLRPSSNPFLVREAIGILTKFRDLIKESGFDKDMSSFLLTKLYGVDHDGEPPAGVYRKFLTLSKLATEAQNRNEPSVVDALKNAMIDFFNIELEYLERQEVLRKALHERKGEFEALAGLIPYQDAMDRLVRYEAHLSREFDRILNQLERVQRMRRGQSPPPALNVNVS